MQPSDISRLVTVGQPALSPDGARIAYVVSRVDAGANRYRSAIWIAASDGATPAYALTSGRDSDGAPRWSPDSRSLAFARSRRGHRGHAAHELLVATPGEGGEPLVLAHRNEPIGGIRWSPDSRRIAFVSRVRANDAPDPAAHPPRRITHLGFQADSEGYVVDRPRHLFVVTADSTGDCHQVTGGREVEGPATWTADGSLVVASARHDDWDLIPAIDLWRVSPDGGTIERLTATGAACSLPAAEPGGERIAHFRSGIEDRYHHDQLAVWAPGGGDPVVLTGALNRSAHPYGLDDEPQWEGEAIWHGIEDRGRIGLARTTLDGVTTRVVDGDRWVTGYSVARGVVAFTATTTDTPTELFVLRDGREQRLTHHQDDFLRHSPAVATERFEVEREDGLSLDAWVAFPPSWDGRRPHPALLLIHGGPATQYGDRWFDEVQLYASAGHVVVYTNPRGSSGRSEGFANAILSPLASPPGTGWGGVDYDDLMAVMDAALARYGAIDGNRLGVLGGSYGGYMTSWIVGHTDRFRAACAERACTVLPVQDWSSDAAGHFREALGVELAGNYEEWWRMSPLRYVEAIHTPLLVIHSDNDLRCNREQGDALFVELRKLRREVVLYRFPAESHEMSRSGSPAHRTQRAEIIIGWFNDHLAAVDAVTASE